MEHIYQNIHGWFSFPNLYKEMVNKASEGSVFVEVGTWKGQSAAFMAVEIAKSSKNIKFYCVDPGTGETKDNYPQAYNEHKEVQQNTLYESFLSNIEPVKEYIIPIRDYSLNAVKQFENESLDFVFIDASHDYDSVLADLNAWYPKIKKRGILAGHDFPQHQVKKAVTDFNKNLNLTLNELEFCYILHKNE
jgi:predicted O-methyltransferase YrrM